MEKARELLGGKLVDLAAAGEKRQPNALLLVSYNYKPRRNYRASCRGRTSGADAGRRCFMGAEKHAG